MLPLHEALFLLALHDERGSVHPSAYIALDQGLRASVLGELRARRRLRILEDRIEVRSTEPVGDPLLDEVLALVGELESPSGVRAWLDHLQEVLPDVREQVVAALVSRGVLSRATKDLPELEAQEQLPTADARFEDEIKRRLREVLLEGGDVKPRMWHLVSLVSACNLVEIHFLGAERELAEAQAQSVVQGDALGRAVAQWRAEAEGTWEF